MVSAAPPYSPPRRSKAWRWLAVIVVVLLVLLVAADRIGVVVAERIAADRIQSAQNLRQRPSVDVDGFPFLTQLASGSFDKVTVTMHDVDVGQDGHVATLNSLRTVLHHVDMSDNFHTMHARTLAATGSAPLAQVSRLLGQTITYAGSGRLSATRSVTVLGRSITATVTSKPVVQGGALSFTDTRIEGAGSAVASVSAQISALFDLTVPLNNIPFGLRAQSVAVDPSGVTFALTGADVSLTQR